MSVSNALHNLNSSFTIRFFQTQKSGGTSEILPVEISGKLFLPVEKGPDFSIQVQNTSHKKFEICTGVDGVSVSSEEALTYKSRGYQLNPYDRCIIKGYRQNDEIEAAFAITDDEVMTVRAQTPHLNISPDKKGKIEFLFWEERETQTPRNASYSQESYSNSHQQFRGNSRGGSYSKGVEKRGSSSDSYESYELQSTVGMGMGKDIKSPTHEVEFYRGSHTPCLTVVINFLSAIQIQQMEEVIKKIDRAAKPFPTPLNFEGVKRILS